MFMTPVLGTEHCRQYASQVTESYHILFRIRCGTKAMGPSFTLAASYQDFSSVRALCRIIETVMEYKAPRTVADLGKFGSRVLCSHLTSSRDQNSPQTRQKMRSMTFGAVYHMLRSNHPARGRYGIRIFQRRISADRQSWRIGFDGKSLWVVGHQFLEYCRHHTIRPSSSCAADKGAFGIRDVITLSSVMFSMLHRKECN
jgi:hypothetical protein